MALQREIIGHDIEEATTTANKEVSATRNILGTSSILTTPGTMTIDLSPIKLNSLHYFAKYVHISSAMNLSTNDVKRDFEGMYRTMRYGDSEASALPIVWRDEADVEITSANEGNEALQHVVTLHFKGDRQYFTYNDGELTEIPDFDPTDFRRIWFEDGISERRDFALFFLFDSDEFN